MNLWLRLIWLLISTPFRGKLKFPGGTSVLHFRVWLHDLDTSLHMNNGRYLTLMDLGRFDIVARSGLLKIVIEQRLTPIASAIAISFRRELRLFQKFRIETRLLHWDQWFVVMDQIFIIVGGPRDGQIATRALFQGGLYDRSARAFKDTHELRKALGVDADSPPPSPEIEAFLKDNEQRVRSMVQAAQKMT